MSPGAPPSRRSMRAAVRGCAGKTTGRREASERRASRIAASESGSSTLLGRWSVTTAKRARERPKRSSVPRDRAARRCLRSESIIEFPTKWIFARSIPSATRLSTASSDGVKRKSESWSVTMRLISSGMLRSRLLRPDSTCPTGIIRFAAASAQATVEFTSPATSTSLGGDTSRSASKRSRIRAVWMAWLAEPTSRFTSGSGRPSSSKKTRDMAAS